MNITVTLIVATITLIAGQISKMLPLPNKYIPLQNLIIAFISIIVCICLKVENMSVLQTIITCVFASMSAGGIADMKIITRDDKKYNSTKNLP